MINSKVLTHSRSNSQPKQKLRTFTQTPKVLLNMNAARFKLETLNSNTFRYENIYKNLLREIRRHCIALFNRKMEFITKRTDIKEKTFFQTITEFLQ